jgi:hypothetical protein
MIKKYKKIIWSKKNSFLEKHGPAAITNNILMSNDKIKKKFKKTHQRKNPVQSGLTRLTYDSRHDIGIKN